MSSPSPERGRPVIALLSDFGARSFYPGAMKGVLSGLCPDASLIDISHDVKPYAIDEASYVLALVFEFFPEGTVFLAVVDPGVGGERDNVIVRAGGRYVVGPDNGLTSDVHADFGVEACYSIRESALEKIRNHRPVGRTFLGRDVFAPVAAALARGDSPESLGRTSPGLQRVGLPAVELGKRTVRGWSRYVDQFGNILTNIKGADIAEAFGEMPLAGIRATVNNEDRIDGIYEYFSQGKPGKLMAILNAWGRIEISCNLARAIDRYPGRDRIEVRIEG